MSKPNLRTVPGTQAQRQPLGCSQGAPLDENRAQEWGGARLGAGRKPKAIRYAAQLSEAEGKIIAALPDVIDGLIEAAKGGDVAAARYLLDRVWGRVPEAGAPVAEDVGEPLDEGEWEKRDAEGAKMRTLREGLF